jgi:hypothetical protein
MTVEDIEEAILRRGAYAIRALPDLCCGIAMNILNRSESPDAQIVGRLNLGESFDAQQLSRKDA